MRNEATLNLLSTELQRNCGDMLAACKAVGVSLIFVNQWRKDDKVADETLREAANVGTQGLVSAAIKRAVVGVEEDVYYKGEIVGQKTVYSDSLLTTLLKAKVPEFDKSEGGGVNVNVNVANLMPRASSYEQWLEMKARTLEPSDTGKAAAMLMAPDDVEIIDAPFTEVPSFGGIEL